MMIYNDEQFAVISKAKPHFETARREYIRNAPRWLTEDIIRTYEDATGRTIGNKDLSCAVCVLRIYQTVGKTYFADLEERNRIEEAEKNTLIQENGESEQVQGNDKEGDPGDVPQRVLKKKNSRRNSR